MTRSTRLAAAVALAASLLAAACQPAPPPPAPAPAPPTTARPDPAASNPIGWIDSVAVSSSRVTVTGWALDPDTTAPIDVWVSIDGRHVATVAANLRRPDVDAVHRKGPDHGFTHTVQTKVGDRRVCVQAINRGAGNASPSLGCRSVATGSSVPAGFVDAGRFPGSNYTVRVHPSAAAMTPDVAAAAAAIEARTGVALRMGTPATSTQPDFATNEIVVHVGAGCGGTSVGCARTWWDASSKLIVGSAVSVVPAYANHVLTRPLLMHEMAHSMGLEHFTDTFAGQRQLMHTNLNPQVTTLQTGDINGLVEVGAEGRRRLASRAPIGVLEQATGTPGRVRLAGWAADPDLGASSANVAVTIDGVTVLRSSAARLLRPDVAAGNPGLGQRHGFAFELRATPGARRVCVTARNVGWGSDTRLGCSMVTVPALAGAAGTLAAPAEASTATPALVLESETEGVFVDTVSLLVPLLTAGRS